jgi:hypothetical protein
MVQSAFLILFNELCAMQDYGDEMRACHATSEIEEEECIIEIPLKCLITVEMGKETNVRILLYLIHCEEYPLMFC